MIYVTKSDEGKISDTSPAFSGSSVCGGVVVGRLKFFCNESDDRKKEHIYLNKSLELERLRRGIAITGDELDRLCTAAYERLGEKEADIFAVHKLFLEDEEITERIEAYISDGSVAEEAIALAISDYEKIFEELNDPYLSSRIADVKDVFSKVASSLDGTSTESFVGIGSVAGEKTIIVAPDLTPSQTLMLDRQCLGGFVTFGGSYSSHTAILSRAMGIPAIIGTGPIDASFDGMMAVLDGDKGKLLISPDEITLRKYIEKIEEDKQVRQRLEAFRGVRSITKSGRRIRLFANIGGVEDAETAIEWDAEGIGLLRSEFLYLERRTLPDEKELFDSYRRIAEIMGDMPVIIRTLDVGADKQAKSLPSEKEENPALGMRGIRLCFANEDIFKTQIRAICRASAYGNIALMLPMVISTNEVRKARQLIFSVQQELRMSKIPFDPDMKIGVMIETPAAAIMADELAQVSDFFSIGSNDLCQYTLVADRQNKALEYLLNDIEPVMRLISHTVEKAHRHGIWVGVCGELAADTGLTERFIGMGVDELSVSAPYVLKIREKILDCNI